MASYTPLTPSEQENMDLYRKMLETVLKADGYNTQMICALTGMGAQGVKSVRDGGSTIKSLIKIMDALGYQVSFTKIKKAKKISDDLNAVTRLMNLKTKRNKYDDEARKRGRKKRAERATQQQLREQQKRTGDIFAVD